MLYPEVSDTRKLVAFAAGLLVGAVLGILCYTWLGRLRRRGRIGRFVAQLWAWFIGYLSGAATAVAVAGPYLFAGQSRGSGGYRWHTDPTNTRELVGMSVLCAVLFALLGLRDPPTA